MFLGDAFAADILAIQHIDATQNNIIANWQEVDESARKTAFLRTLRRK